MFEMELDLSALKEFSTQMDEVEYWFTVAMYIIFGSGLLIILCGLYKILCCGVCLVNGVFSPCKCLARCCKSKKKEPLLPGDPILRR